MREIEAKQGRPIAEVIRELYAKHAGEARIQETVARELGISQPTLSLWLTKLRLTQRIVVVPDNRDC
jgi:hypothetical protein